MIHMKHSWLAVRELYHVLKAQDSTELEEKIKKTKWILLSLRQKLVKTFIISCLLHTSVIIKPADNRMSLTQRIHHIMKYKLQNNSPHYGNTNCQLRVWVMELLLLCNLYQTYCTPHFCNKMKWFYHI